jgi:precorrin-2 dehydrogenase/sirohydrochlorin ferrochelatase
LNPAIQPGQKDSMLPIVLDPAKLAVGLAGAGEGLARRQAMLEQAGVTPLTVAADAPESALAPLSVLFVAGLDLDRSARLAQLARNAGVLVNVEDVPDLCDFHVPAAVRRGDLVVTVSTGGKAPGLSRILREWLEDRFSGEWTARLDDLSAARSGWREDGLSPNQVSQNTRDLVAKKGWLS